VEAHDLIGCRPWITAAGRVARALLVVLVVLSGHVSCHMKGMRADTEDSKGRAQLDALDERYAAIARTLELAEWGRFCEVPTGDPVVAMQARAAFVTDPKISRTLHELAASHDTELASRARAWHRFLDELRPTTDPEVVRLREQLITLRQSDDGMKPVAALVAGSDSDERQRALASLESRFPALQAIMVARARRLDGLARELGYDGYVSLQPGAHGARELLTTCRKQAAATEADWQRLRARATRRLGRPPTLADFLAESTRWTHEASAFLEGTPVDSFASRALSYQGFDLASLQIDVRRTRGSGGRAFAISLPDDVRFCGAFPPGYEGARGYLHELGHAIHMKLIRAPHLPGRAMPSDTGLAEGVAEIFALLARDRHVLGELFPDADLAEFEAAVAAYDAAALRYVCLHALVEAELQDHGSIDGERFAALVLELFGEPSHTKPVWIFLPYLDSALHVQDYVWARELRDTFLARLGDVPLASREARRYLVDTLLEPGNALTAEEWLRSAPALARWRAR
jgi:hypothetical protein